MSQNTPSLRELEHHNAFVERHIGPNDAEIAQMLDVVGHASLDGMTDAIVPAKIKSPAPLALPSDAELADTPTPKPQGGMWTLTAPDGRTYQADSPLRCCGLEQRERVPADVAMARIFRAASEPDDSELLDWLDATNKRFKMGWKVGVAPAGNCSVQSIICLGNSELVNIRAAIRAAIAQERKA